MAAELPWRLEQYEACALEKPFTARVLSKGPKYREIEDRQENTSRLKIPLNGAPAVKLSVAIKRPDGMSFGDFDRYWNTPHAEIVTSVPEFTRHVRRYVQSHVVQDYTGTGDSKLTNQWRFAPFDGVAELWFDGAADVVRAFNEPAFIDKIAPDDKNFVDQAGTKLLIVQEIEKFPNLVYRYAD